MGPRGAFLGVGQQQQYQPAPNAALLIDFDNVTMAIRSDLGKELKTLLKSEIIRGKVAVQRAYADWRRYPQYIVPLTESSVDLIFAPAYGSSKKNATDLRMAIDAIELVFTRPEIGTFILMTGDSDFSSCVLKLKEYGKYVIGVGMRESSSDLLIQNCDEYFSYHSISGLTRAGEVVESKEDPWLLVRRAVQQMVKNGDVMRTDRLKQVMLDLDAGFDEKKVGYSKFSRFVSEAASKGVIRLRKTENGQYEILPETGIPETREKVVERIVAEAEAVGNGRRRRGGRGRDDRPREPRPPREEVSSTGDEPKVEPEVVAAQPRVEATPAATVTSTPAPTPAPAPAAVPAAGRETPIASRPTESNFKLDPTDVEGAYTLLQEAVRRLVGRDSKPVRDGDVKRKMLEIARNFDEAQLGFGKFTHFLRQAHDAEVIDLSRIGAGNYEVALPTNGAKLRPRIPISTGPAQEESAGRATGTPQSAPAARETGRGPERAAPSGPPASSISEAVSPPETEPVAALPATQRTQAPAAGVGALRGRRGGRASGTGPPPILPGQTVASPIRTESAGRAEPTLPVAPIDAASVSEVTAEPTGQTAAETEPASADSARPRSRNRRGRRGRGKDTDTGSLASDAGEVSPSQTDSVATEEGAPEISVPVWNEPTVESTPSSEIVASPSPSEAPASGGRSRRGRRGGGSRTDAPPAILEGQIGRSPSTPAVDPETAEQAAIEPAVAEAPPEPEVAAQREAPAVQAPSGAQVAAPASSEMAASGNRSRRGRRGGGNRSDAPPPILEGQIGRAPSVSSGSTMAAGSSAPESATVAPEPEVALPEEVPTAASSSRLTAKRRGRGGKGAKPAPAALDATPKPASKPAAVAKAAPVEMREVVPPVKAANTAKPAKAAKAPGAKKPVGKSTPDAFSAEALGLPTEPEAISTYLTTSYKGVGKKTADTLLDKFGTGLFQAMQERTSEVRSLLDERRAGTLIDQWKADYAKRSPKIVEPAAPAVADTEKKPGASSRGRRGGRGKGGGKKEPTPAS